MKGLQERIIFAPKFLLSRESQFFRLGVSLEHLCNHLLADYEPYTNATQKCTYVEDIADKHTLIYKDCEEDWCFAFISSEKKKNGRRAILKGCESRSLLKHHQTKAMDQEFSNNTDWIYSEGFVNAPRCAEIVAAATGGGVDDENITAILEGEKRYCLDLKFKQDGVPTQAKICCCRGNHKCNEDIAWGDVAIKMADIEEYRKLSNMNNKASSNWIDLGLIWLTLFSAFVVFLL